MGEENWEMLVADVKSIKIVLRGMECERSGSNLVEWKIICKLNIKRMLETARVTRIMMGGNNCGKL